MATITIRRLDETLKEKLRVRAATHGRSMEEEARDFARSIRRHVTPLGGVELPLPRREAVRHGRAQVRVPTVHNLETGPEA
ncbi:MAG: hypothetical protein WB676_09635 [Bryobacteraceae bacterium]